MGPRAKASSTRHGSNAGRSWRNEVRWRDIGLNYGIATVTAFVHLATLHNGQRVIEKIWAYAGSKHQQMTDSQIGNARQAFAGERVRTVYLDPSRVPDDGTPTSERATLSRRLQVQRGDPRHPRNNEPVGAGPLENRRPSVYYYGTATRDGRVLVGRPGQNQRPPVRRHALRLLFAQLAAPFAGQARNTLPEGL